MIVGGPTGRQHKAEKEENVRPSLAGIDESFPAGGPAQKCQTPKSRHKKRDIRNNIAEVRDAQPASPIRELVVGKRLWSSREEQRRNSNCSRQGQEGPKGGTTPKHRPHGF